MKKLPVLAVSTLSAFLLAAPAMAKDESIKVIAKVNGTKITQSDLQTYAVQRTQGSGSKPGSIPRNILIEELVNQELLYQDALKQKLDKKKSVAERLNRIKRDALSMEAINHAAENAKISEKDLKATYDARIATTEITEYKARHILVETEESAKELIKSLEAGADFIKLAKEKSTGPSAPNGGDLGWFTPNRMVPPFSQAVIALKNGEFSKTPVQTQFGWHVILREDSKAAEPPAFETVKPQIEGMMKRQKIQEYIAGLRKGAKVELFDEEAKK